MTCKTLLPAACLLLSLPGIALADVTYTYTGKPFSSFSGTVYSPADSVHGSITFTDSTTIDGSDGLTVYQNVVGYNISDGVHQYTSTSLDANSYAFVETAYGGNVVYWGFTFDSFANSGVYTVGSTNPRSGVPSDFGQFNLGGVVSSGENSFNRGSWSGPSVTAPTPEPASLALLGSGLLGAFGAFRRRTSR